MLRTQKNSVVNSLNERVIDRLNSQASTNYIFTEAIKRVLTEFDNNFDRDLHNVLHDKTGITTGCGCTFCIALKNYRYVKLDLHRTKKMFEHLFDTLSDIDENWYRKRILNLEQTSKDARELKNKYKKELNL